jgi:uncharacterized protein YjbI with pentapeptide repeats
VRTLAAALCALALVTLCPIGARAGVPKVCTGCNLAGSNLRGDDFSNAVYIGANFSGSDLERVNFSHANLTGADFENADLRKADFSEANCTGCNLEGARLDGATFDGTNVTGGNLRGFDGRIGDAVLRSLLDRCVGCNLSDAKLGRRDLSGIRLIGIDFSSADLRGTKFDGAQVCWHNTDHVDGYDIRSTIDCIDLRGAQVAGASFRGVKLCDSAGGSRSCSAVDAQTLRRYSDSDLTGAILP